VRGAREQGEGVLAAIQSRLRTGRPLADAEWITEAERAINRKMAPARRCPKLKGA